jgi:hypothetical protein
MMKSLVETARKQGIKGFTAEVLADNVAMLRVFHHAAVTIESKLEGGVYSLTMLFAEKK